MQRRQLQVRKVVKYPENTSQNPHRPSGAVAIAPPPPGEGSGGRQAAGGWGGQGGRWEVSYLLASPSWVGRPVVVAWAALGRSWGPPFFTQGGGWGTPEHHPRTGRGSPPTHLCHVSEGQDVQVTVQGAGVDHLQVPAGSGGRGHRARGLSLSRAKRVGFGPLCTG